MNAPSVKFLRTQKKRNGNFITYSKCERNKIIHINKLVSCLKLLNTNPVSPITVAIIIRGMIFLFQVYSTRSW